MRTKIILTIITLIILIGCQPKCNDKIVCDDGETFPAEEMKNGLCVKIDYETGPCSDKEADKAECEKNEDCTPEEPLVGAQYLCEEGKCVQKPLGNPAAMKCEEDGGKIEIKEGEEGQYGICTLPDGTECEEWAYFRGECPETPKGKCGTEPAGLRSQCCQKELKCDVTKIAVYSSSTGQCTCEPTDIQRQCAAVQCETGKFSVYDPNIGECICVQSGTGTAEAGPQTETKEINTWQEAKEAVLAAFDTKYRKIPGGCGEYKDGKMTPEKVTIEEQTDGTFKATVLYYCATFGPKPAEPDHKKEVIVTRDGQITGL